MAKQTKRKRVTVAGLREAYGRASQARREANEWAREFEVEHSLRLDAEEQTENARRDVERHENNADALHREVATLIHERDAERTHSADLAADLRAAKAERNAEAVKVGQLAAAGNALMARAERAEKIASAQAAIIRAQADLVAALSEPVKPGEIALAK